MDLSNRCTTDEQKEEFMSRLLLAWKQTPNLRFGQLVRNSMFPENDLFYLEDLYLLDQVESFVSDY